MQETASKELAAASKEWRNSLIDVGGSNRLLYFRPNASTVSLDSVPPSAAARLLSGKTVRLNELFPDSEDMSRAQKAFTTLSRKQREAQEEFGVSIAYLAVGTASWDPEASGAIAAAEAEQVSSTGEETKGRRPKYTRPSAPVLLRPVELSRKRGAQDSWELRLNDDFSLNTVFAHVMNADRIRLDEEAILEVNGGAEAGMNAMLDAIETACADVVDFSIERHQYLGAFTYSKQPMVMDIDNVDALASSDIVKALAGDPSAAARVRQHRTEVSDRAPDHTPVESEYLVLDADASQSYVVNAAVAGNSLVVQGPPGTGKSQTIANTIASLAAANKKVLFVAQKRAAVTAVLDRLDGAKLDHLVLDLFAASGSRRFVADELRDVLERQQATGIPDVAALEFTLANSRQRLVSHSNALDKGRGWGPSVMVLRSRLPGIPEAARSSLRLPPQTFSTWTASSLTEYGTALDELHDLGALHPAWNSTPGWHPKSLDTPEAVSQGTTTARTLSGEIPGLLKSLQGAAYTLGRPAPETWAAVEDLLRLAEEIHAVQTTLPQSLSPEMTGEELERLLCSTDRSYAKASEQRPGWLQKRALRKHASTLNPMLQLSEIHKWLLRAAAIRSSWQASGPAHVDSETLHLIEAARSLRNELSLLQQKLQHIDFQPLPLSRHTAILDDLTQDPKRLQMPRVFAHGGLLAQAGLSGVVGRLRTDLLLRQRLDFQPSQFLEWVATKSVLDDAEMNDPGLAGVTGKDLASATTRFAKADREHLKANSARIQRLAAERLKSALDAHPEEHSILKTELTRKRNFRSVRTLFNEAPNVVRAVKPVWAMSPLQASQLLPATQCFDVVIFDEASQVKPADAIPALLRAKQAIIAGDSRQLPPTEFFTKLLEDLPLAAGQDGTEEPDLDEDASLDADVKPAAKPMPTGSLTQDAESILFAMDRLLVGQSRRLLWHYRSRDERLIAVSNAHVYAESLTTFPAADSRDAIRHVAVDPSLGIGQTTASPIAEVERVVQLVREHVADRPKESLGVITFGVKHQRRIEAEIDRIRGQDPEFDAALSAHVERFFIKSIERVQGDERDAIILTMGYGKGLDGKMRLFWGPLLQEGGERRLNVAISRARSHMTLVTSFTADDVPEDGHPSAGYTLMHRFLRFMSSNGTELHGRADNTAALNPFEIDVRDRLTAAGLALDSQIGVGSYRIDFAVRHPDFPGRHVLAIEADGASYHSGRVARERDRLRQSLLERRGWTFHRIWSTDWFNDADAEVLNAVNAFNTALARVSEAERPAATTQQPAVADHASWHVRELKRTAPKPHLIPGKPITSYPSGLIKDLVLHVRSDGILRSADEEIDIIKTELGFSKRGRNIVAAIEQAQRQADGTQHTRPGTRAENNSPPPS